MAGCAGIRSEFRWEPDPLHPNHAGRCRLRLYPGLGVSSDPVHCLEPLGSAGAHTGQDEISRCGCSPQSDGKSGHSMAKPFSWGAELESPDSGCPSRVWQWCRMVPEVAKRESGENFVQWKNPRRSSLGITVFSGAARSAGGCGEPGNTS